MADITGYSARILVNGHKVKEYNHEGTLFIEAKFGTEYEIELKNHTPQRVMAIVSIDGLDVIKGKPATNDSAGYIIKAYDSVRIKGFRKDSETVGAFKFTNRENSYSKSQNRGGNQGIIAVRFVSEWPQYGNFITDSNSSAVGSSFMDFSSKCSVYDNKIVNSTTGNLETCRGITYSQNIKDNSFDMGTTWGSKQKDKVKETEFDRGSIVGEINFYYASRNSLIDMGVPLINEKMVSLPKGFQDFCQPPKGWR